MKNFISPGKSPIIRNSPIDAKSGDLVVIGPVVGVAVTDCDQGDDLVIAREGQFYLPKVLTENIDRHQYLSLAEEFLTADTSQGPIVAISWENSKNGASHLPVILLDSALPATEATSGPET